MARMSHRRPSVRPAWSGLAVVVEAMVLLIALVGSLAVLTQLFAGASIRATEGEHLAEAVACATNTAEHFAADPLGTEGTSTEGALVVTCTVEPSETAQGTLYRASITVSLPEGSDPIYTLHTSRYLPDNAEEVS